jgi:hypothetical protein
MRDVDGVRLEIGEVAARLVLFGSPHAEISIAMRPPWPSWMHRLYELEAIADDQTKPAVEEVSVGAALHALAERLRHRLDLAAFVVNATAELGWSATLSEDSIVIRKLLQPDLAVDELERAGILGPMSKLCELDERGLPRIYQ